MSVGGVYYTIKVYTRVKKTVKFSLHFNKLVSLYKRSARGVQQAYCIHAVRALTHIRFDKRQCVWLKSSNSNNINRMFHDPRAGTLLYNTHSYRKNSTRKIVHIHI